MAMFGGWVTAVRTGIEKTTNNENDEVWEADEVLITTTFEPTEKDRGTLISDIIRDRYSSDRMEAVINNYLLDPEDEKAKAEFDEMQAWRREAKRLAGEIIKSNQ